MTLAIFPASIFVLLALLHVFWAFSRRRGVSAALPSKGDKPLFEPGPLACLVVAALLLTAALLYLSRAGLVGVFPPATAKLGTWGVALAFTARAIGDFRYVGFFKKVTDTPFGRLDTRLYSPLCGVLAGFGYWLASVAG